MNLRHTIILGTSLALFSEVAFAQTQTNTAQTYTAQINTTQVNAAQFLGAEYMQSLYHRVLPQAISDGVMLTYTIETSQQQVSITGTEQAKIRIHEIHATETLRQRSTGGAILDSAKDRTTNLVETPYRIGKTLVNRAGDISNVEEAVLFVPEQVLDTAGNLLSGVGELGVTAMRITKGAAGTKCSGLKCIEKAGSDIWSGVNSLAGKHNASRRLHAEFGTDPQTDNKAYRKQIDRLAYANSYTGTTIKLGAGQAGIEYLSPAFTNVGYVNNAEFVGQYEDAHRQKKHEKEILESWGADLQAIDNFYANTAYTKANRRRLFRALNTLQDKPFAVTLFYGAADIDQRYAADSHVLTYEYIASLAANDEVAAYIANSADPLIALRNGTVILPIYADYLTWSPQLENSLQNLSQSGQRGSLHVLGYAGPRVKQLATKRGIQVVEWPGRARPL